MVATAHLANATQDKKAARKAKRDSKKAKPGAKATKTTDGADATDSAPAAGVEVGTKESAASTAVETAGGMLEKRGPSSMKASVEEVEDE